MTRASLDALLSRSRKGLLGSRATVVWLQTNFPSCKFDLRSSACDVALANLILDGGPDLATATVAVL